MTYPGGSELPVSLRPGVGATAGVLQQRELEFKRLFVESPVLIFVEEGVKSLRCSDGAHLIRARYRTPPGRRTVALDMPARWPVRQVRDLTLTVKVRRVIGKDVARERSANAVASAFSMSEATSRRKLADEDASLGAILIDVRMTFALQLLQSTTQPVAQIALAVGYQTPSQFAVRFCDRFGFAPTMVRGASAHGRRRRPFLKKLTSPRGGDQFKPANTSRLCGRG